jgi:putative nucleotidyltransferase with HDIG domain
LQTPTNQLLILKCSTLSATITTADPSSPNGEEDSIHELGWVRAIHPTIEPLFQQLGSLCSLPGIASKVIEVAEDPDSNAHDMLKVIEQDQAVAARLMQVVNSAHCGLRTPASDLKTAVTLLGAERVRNLALTVSMGSMFSNNSTDARFNIERLWDHSVCVASIARMIAQRKDYSDPDEAYLAGLLHDLGLLVICQHLTKLVPRIFDLCEKGLALSVAESQVLAFDHAQLGAYIARRSSFPQRLITAIDYHHDPLNCPEEGRELTRIVSVANYLTTRHGRGSIEGRRLPAPPEGVLGPMGLTLQAFRELWDDLPETIANVSELTGQ